MQESKLQLARECGADLALNAGAGPVHKEIKKLGGMHVVLVASGSKVAYEAALRYLRKGGTLVIVGMSPEPISVSTVAMIGLEARILSSSVGTRQDLREMLALIAKHPEIHCHVETRPLSALNEAFDQVRRGELVGRVVIRP